MIRETSLFLRLWANASSEAYLRTHKNVGSCESQRICTHVFIVNGDTRSRIEAKPLAVEERERRATGAAYYQRLSVRRTCGIARRQPSKGVSAACGGEEGGSRRETGMAAAARAARGAIGGHSPALRAPAVLLSAAPRKRAKQKNNTTGQCSSPCGCVPVGYFRGGGRVVVGKCTRKTPQSTVSF